MRAAAYFPLVLLLVWSCHTVQHEAVPAATQPTSVAEPLDTALAYSSAIGDYIAAMTKRDGSFADTLYINQHVDFPNVNLPAVIARCVIRSVSPEEAEAVKGGVHFACLNIFGWFTDSTAEFRIVRFEQGFRHRPDGRDDCQLYYSIGSGQQAFALDSLRF